MSGQNLATHSPLVGAISATKGRNQPQFNQDKNPPMNCLWVTSLLWLNTNVISIFLLKFLTPQAQTSSSCFLLNLISSSLNLHPTLTPSPYLLLFNFNLRLEVGFSWNLLALEFLWPIRFSLFLFNMMLYGDYTACFSWINMEILGLG